MIEKPATGATLTAFDGSAAPAARGDTRHPTDAVDLQPFDDATALELLRTYEPVLAYTTGERFFPTDVAGYIACCSLLRNTTRGTEQVVPAGELTVQRLVAAATEEHPSANLSMLLVQKPFSRRAARRSRRADRPKLAISGRLAAVGLLARVVDVLLRLSLLLRGNVPGGVAAAAAHLYRQRMNPEHCPYYGRVLRDGGYVVLQYWYFYAMNDWRTRFGGVNDHEADWEAVTIFLTETAAKDGGSQLRPAWVAISAHDNTGDDLRRRWDDPDLRRSGDHPVVFVGAGSHSGAVVPGQYVVSVNPESARKYLDAIHRVTALVFPWTRSAKQHGVGVPYLDYALGNGEKIGPGGSRAWHPQLINDGTPWVRDFRGLWGRDPRDWLGGERAPAGPRYDRDGRVRQLWTDPLGWAGLQKLPADREQGDTYLRERLAELTAQLATVDEEIAAGRTELRRLRATAASLGQYASAKALAWERFTAVAQAENELGELIRQRSELAEELAAHQTTLNRPPAPEGPQAHLRAPHLPHTPSRGPRAGFLRLWAALSTPLFILALAGIFLIPDIPHAPPLGAVIALFIAVEAWARHKLRQIGTVLLIVAAAVGVIALAGYAVAYGGRYVALSPLVIAAGVLFVVNLRDLLRG